MNLKTCAFTGHRPQRFPFGFDENDERCLKLKTVLKEQIESLAAGSVTDFYTGMALGVVIIMHNQIIARVNSDLDILLDEADVDAILKGEHSNFGEDVKRIANETARVFVSDLFGKLRERGVDLRSGRTVFVGGGSILLRSQIEASGKAASPAFVDRITANAKGYELLYKTSARR